MAKEIGNGTRERIREMVFSYFSEECDVPREELTDETHVIEDLEGDSLMILALLERVRRENGLTVELKTLEIWQVGTTAYETGIWSYAFTPPGKTPQKIGGKYVTVWAQQPDGGWRIQGDIGVPGT